MKGNEVTRIPPGERHIFRNMKNNVEVVTNGLDKPYVEHPENYVDVKLIEAAEAFSQKWWLNMLEEAYATNRYLDDWDDALKFQEFLNDWDDALQLDVYIDEERQMYRDGAFDDEAELALMTPDQFAGRAALLHEALHPEETTHKKGVMELAGVLMTGLGFTPDVSSTVEQFYNEQAENTTGQDD